MCVCEVCVCVCVYASTSGNIGGSAGRYCSSSTVLFSATVLDDSGAHARLAAEVYVREHLRQY